MMQKPLTNKGVNNFESISLVLKTFAASTVKIGQHRYCCLHLLMRILIVVVRRLSQDVLKITAIVLEDS